MLKFEVRRARRNNSGVYSTLRAEKSPVATYMRSIGREVQTLSKLLVGVRTGQLKRSIKMSTERQTKRGDYTVIVGSDIRHALVHHEGARPHIIRAKPGKMLRFQGKRGYVVTSSVQHPGHEGRKYLLAALTVVMQRRT